MKKTILKKKSKIIKPVVIRWEFTNKIDWRFIGNDFKSDWEKRLHANCAPIVEWFKERIQRYDITRANRIKLQYDYIRQIENDTTRDTARKEEILISARAVLDRLIHE